MCKQPVQNSSKSMEVSAAYAISIRKRPVLAGTGKDNDVGSSGTKDAGKGSCSKGQETEIVMSLPELWSHGCYWLRCGKKDIEKCNTPGPPLT